MENQELLQAMFEEATLGILVVNADGEIQNANPFSEKLFGYAPGELQGQKVEMLLPEAFRKAHVQHRKKYHQHPTPRTMGANLDLAGQRKDGSEFPVEISLSFTNVNNEKLAIAYVSDISHKKNIIEDLQIKDTAISKGAMPIAFSDMEGNITEVNDAFVKLWGYENQSEIIGMNNRQLSFTNAEVEEINSTIHHQGRWAGEATAMKKDGSSFGIFVSSNLMLNEQGKPTGMMASFMDITPLKKTESINRDISRIVEESLNEIFIFDAKDFKFIQVNKGGRQNIGYSMEELKQLTPADIKPLFSKKQFADYMQPLLKGETQKLQFETIHERKDKTTYPVEIHLEYSTLGNEPVFVATILDISERKEAESYTEAILSSIGSHIAVVNPEGEILTVNKAWEDFAKENTNGQISGTGVGTNYIEVCKKSSNLGNKDAETSLQGIQGILDGELEEFELVYPCHSPKEKRWFLLQVKPLSHINEGAAIVHLNITAQQEAEEKLRQLNVELEEKVKDRTLRLIEKRKKLERALEKEKELSELKSRFVSMASHEFRTPLSSILSSANLIGHYEEGEQQDKRMRHVNRIASSVKNLTFILNDFLNLEKLESGKVRFHPAAIDFEEYVESFMDEIRLLAKGKQEIIFRHSGERKVLIDDNLVKNVLINLLSNAVKYSPEGKDVELISKNENGMLEIAVIDEGIGIPKADHAGMFSRFFRAKNVENIQGTGLGLTIVKRYLDLMGGEIGFESEQFKGSTFRVKIPQ